MDSNEARLLAQHMGHDYNIHIKHYAMQTNLLERSKVARVLCAISHGVIKAPDTQTDISTIATPVDSDVVDAEQPTGRFII